ncbi:MAG: class II fructose-bisphosphate aldolase [Patescibacteria group bacterium]
MLVSPKILLEKAQKEKYAVGAFNTCNLEITKAIFAAAENLNSPIIIQTSEGESQHGQITKIATLIRKFIEESKIPACLNLDHGKSLEMVKKCITAGYAQVMIDGSKLPFSENIALTKKVVQYAHKYNVPVEGELGLVPTPGQKEIVSEKEREKAMTDPNLALDFVKKTEVDFLAVAIGNVHGFYKGKPVLDFNRLGEIKKKVKIPLVLHGGSGIADCDIKKAISLGICKINVNTELRVAFTNALRQILKDQKQHIPYEYMKTVEQAVQKVVEEKIKVFSK